MFAGPARGVLVANVGGVRFVPALAPGSVAAPARVGKVAAELHSKFRLETYLVYQPPVVDPVLALPVEEAPVWVGVFVFQTDPSPGLGKG